MEVRSRKFKKQNLKRLQIPITTLKVSQSTTTEVHTVYYVRRKSMSLLEKLSQEIKELEQQMKKDDLTLVQMRELKSQLERKNLQAFEEDLRNQGDGPQLLKG